MTRLKTYGYTQWEMVQQPLCAQGETRPLLGSNLGSKDIQGCMHVALASLIEVY